VDHGLDGADAHQPEDVAARAAERDDLAAQLQQPLAVVHQPHADGREPQLARVALEQARADVFFEGGDAVGHRRLRDVEPVARGAEAAQPRGPEEGFYKSCVHEGTCGPFCPHRACTRTCCLPDPYRCRRAAALR